MDYTSLDHPALTDDALLGGASLAPGSSFPGRPRQGAEVLRYRGMVMNLITGSVLIQGRPAHFGADERALLAALLRRSGQIVSPQMLAGQLGVTIDRVEGLASSLTAALRDAGAQCLPRHVEGLGYVLWR